MLVGRSVIILILLYCWESHVLFMNFILKQNASWTQRYSYLLKKQAHFDKDGFEFLVYY